MYRFRALIGLATLLVISSAPSLADYYGIVNGGGLNSVPCDDYEGGQHFTISCVADGICNSNLHSDWVSEEIYANCQTLAGYGEVHSTGSASYVDAWSYAVRSDDVYSFSHDETCSCDYGCTYHDTGTDPIPC